jgi:hypothetical protein
VHHTARLCSAGFQHASQNTCAPKLACLVIAQAEWIARALKGNMKLPSSTQMEEEVLLLPHCNACCTL